MTPFEFGFYTAGALTKQAGGIAGFGKALGSAVGGATKAVPPKPAAQLAPRAAQTAAAAGTGAAAASQTPAGQNAMNTASNMAASVPNVVNRAAAAFHHNPLGKQLAHGWHTYEHGIEPLDRAGMTSPVEFPLQMAEGVHKVVEPVHGMMHGGVGGH